MVLPASDRFWWSVPNGGHASTMAYPGGAAACARHDVKPPAVKKLPVFASSTEDGIVVTLDTHVVNARILLGELKQASHHFIIALHVL